MARSHSGPEALILLDLITPISVPTWVAWIAAASAPLSAIGLAVFVWVIQGKLAEGVKEAMMARLSSIQEEGKQNGLRIEQKIDLLTHQLKENVQAVGTEVKGLPAKIDSSASGIRSEVNDVKKELTDVTAAVRTMQATMQMSFQNLEKTIALYVKAEVSEQLLARSASIGQP